MCGRYNLFSDLTKLYERFELAELADVDFAARYNIAPSQEVIAVVRGSKGNKGGFLKWGLVPSWASDPKIGYKMINARAETLGEKASFKRLLSRRRCLIPADGFYEWKQIEKLKQPFHIRLKSGEPFAFAGLWDRWEQEGQTIHSCTIITTEANVLMKEIHDRMPVILTREAEKEWLNSENTDGQSIKQLLVPYNPEKMEAYPVSPLVNSPKNEGKEILNSL
ncbi:SOS response-associated peptidase [Peribacillus saganii]|uniref:Abasic site processing protein n=1 Tax=Peribacillus saganii TaxID=2303992 RepID=A0A372LUE8_9BACI|nr:SOS response-associated peptidase [Peribacillus saganii]RFU71420.1 SOS response-associated peptidase [Peribacillus saganii]